MDTDVAKAPVPIERLARQLRAARRELVGDAGMARRAAAAAAAVRYHVLLAAAASMLEAPAPRPVSGGPGAEWAEVEAALAREGLDVRPERR